MDSKDPIFPHQISIVKDLTQFAEKISVITYRSSQEITTLPNNVKVYTLGNSGRFKIYSYLKFMIIFCSVLIRNHNTVVFSHMTETLSAIVSPLTRFLRIRHYLWYAHTSKPLRLSWCNIFVDKIITSTRNSCPIKNKKVIPIGQAIRYQDFNCEGRVNEKLSKIHAVHIGRLDPSKKIDKIIDIFSSETKNMDAVLHLVGEPTDGHFNYVNFCREKFKKQIESQRLIFHGRNDHNQIRNLLCESQIFIHLFQGSLDKSLIEATFAKVYVVTANKEYLNDFPPILVRSVEWSDEEYLRHQLKQYFALSSNQIVCINDERYSIAMEKHSRQVWITKLISILNNQSNPV